MVPRLKPLLAKVQHNCSNPTMNTLSTQPAFVKQYINPGGWQAQVCWYCLGSRPPKHWQCSTLLTLYFQHHIQFTTFLARKIHKKIGASIIGGDGDSIVKSKCRPVCPLFIHSPMQRGLVLPVAKKECDLQVTAFTWSGVNCKHPSNASMTKPTLTKICTKKMCT